VICSADPSMHMHMRARAHTHPVSICVDFLRIRDPWALALMLS